MSSTLTASSARRAGPGGLKTCSDSDKVRPDRTDALFAPRSRFGRGQDFSGWLPKWLKGPDCKSGGIAFAGSNPAPPMSGSVDLGRSRDCSPLQSAGKERQTDRNDKAWPPPWRVLRGQEEERHRNRLDRHGESPFFSMQLNPRACLAGRKSLGFTGRYPRV